MRAESGHGRDNQCSKRRIIAENVRRHDARLVHLSSDLVFSGTSSRNYVETDPTDPVSIYGKTMVQAEKLFLDRVPKAILLRIPLPMGPSFSRHAGAIDWIQSRFRAHRPATLYFDEIRSCAYCDDLNGVFEKFLDSRAAGIFHCGGPRPISLYEIGQIVNRVGDFRSELLKGCPRQAAGPMPPRAGNVSMNMGKLIAELGHEPFLPWPVGNDILPTDRNWHCHRPADESRSLGEIDKRLYRNPKLVFHECDGSKKLGPSHASPSTTPRC